ncbi:uncharacterized protein LOC105194698 isoform X2 [Solenopsis invicta]|uniref:uncharacterized protein LOC105194698 isoform X2 n=1 Tax=Solenopsis invicta TaxID=13686 RepID=UPI00193E4107|nr:uncharacterized protein LOC105194698 isoform X2 [Solenopsis invicta]
MLLYIYTIIAFSVAILGLSSANKPTLLTSCKQNSDDYSACLKRAFEEAWPRFIAGMPELNFPSLDPLSYKYGKVVFDSGDLIRADVILSNTTTSGLSKVYIFDIRTHFLDDIFRLEIDVIAPKLFIEGTVNMNGTLGSIFKIASEGPFNLTADDVRGTWDLTGHVVNDTWIVEHFHTLPSVKKLKLYFDFFQNNKEFNDLAVTFANEFWPSLYRVMLPTTSNIWDPWLTDIANKFFSKVSFSKVFL